DIPPAEHLLMVVNDDRPGVIGTVGTTLGTAGVNIDDMDVGRAEEVGTAVMMIATTQRAASDVVDTLRQAPGIVSVATLTG
ncbi:MAG: ACT domain-containing protein, partial [Actinomycetota bacterium]|nr:ACT domain-containing protein [Actinomycetota bacterium]